MNSNEFDGRVVLLAGASGGVGMATAKMLLERGARVALHYRSKGTALADLAASYRDRAQLFKADLTQPAEVDELVRQTT